MLFKIADVCDRYNVGADTVRSWISSGQLAAINVAPAGSKRMFYRITEEALAEFERGRATKTTVRRPPFLPPIRQIV